MTPDLIERLRSVVGARPVEWDESRMHLGFPAFGVTVVGAYTIWEIDGDGYWKHADDYSGTKAALPGLDGAKAAVQSDVEDQLFSALIPVAPVPTPREAELEAALPDYCYDPTEWEWTAEWDMRDTLVDGMPLGSVMEVACLRKLPSKWAAHVPKTWDEAGDPDETEIQFFDTEDAARLALNPTHGKEPKE